MSIYPMKGPPAPHRSDYSRAMDLVAKVGGVLVTFLAWPLVFQITNGWIQEFTSERYGSEWINMASLLWAIIVAAIIYSIVRVLITEFLLKRGINRLMQ